MGCIYVSRKICSKLGMKKLVYLRCIPYLKMYPILECLHNVRTELCVDLYGVDIAASAHTMIDVLLG
jgi:hypothetical protein